MPRIPLPRRGLRAIVVLLVLIFGPYILWKRIAEASDEPRDLQSGSSIGSLVYGGPGRAKDAAKSWANRLRGAGGGGGQAVFNVNDDGPEDDISASKGSKAKSKQGGKGKEEVDPWEAAAAGGGGKAKSKPPPSERKLPKHKYDPNGLVKVNPRGQHPIYDLIDMGKETWTKKLDKSSKTLRQAVDEYRRRYGRAPPKGFDKWWKYVQKHNVRLPDEYDQIFHDLEPFYALRQSQIATLSKEAAEMPGMYTITCPGRGKACSYELNEKGLQGGHRRVMVERAEAQMDLVREIQGDLEEIKAVFYSHDVPWQFVGHEYKTALEDAASVGEYLSTEDHEHDMQNLGWPSACAPHKPLRHDYDMKVFPDLEGLWIGEKSFVWDHKASMDACIHPTYTHLMGFLSSHRGGPGPSEVLYPVMAMCKTTLHSDVLAVSNEAWTEDIGDDPPWDKKSDDRLLWRGKNTGIYYKDSVPWNISQRINLVDHTARTSGNHPILPALQPNKPIGKPQDAPLGRLNKDLVDIGFVNEPIQCDPEVCVHINETYAFKGRKNWQEHNQYKYILDIDGNGWSARFKRLMSTNSAILKSTIFPEWYTDRVQPWVHYIPVKPDLTDLYDILSFFRESGKANEELGKEIATEGKKWSKSFWRHEDMVSYQFRLFLEYSRLLAPDRDAATYHARGSDLEG